MPLTLENKIVVGFTAAVGFMLAVGGAAWWSALRAAETFRWVDHTHEVLYQLEATLVDMLNMQTATRGYLLTSRENFLEPYEAGSARIADNFRKLHELTRDNPDQQDHLRHLEAAMERLLVIMRERIARNRAGDTTAARNPADLEAGNSAIAEVRDRIARMERIERTLLAERSATDQSRRSLAVLIFGFGSLAGTGLVMAAGLIVRADVRQRVRIENALRSSETEYRTLFDSIDEGYCILELIFDEANRPVDFRFVKVNPSFEKLTGLAGALGRRIRELSPDYEDYWFDTYGRVALTGEPVRFQNYAAPLQRWFDIYAFRYGEAAQRQVAVLFRDVTAQRAQDDEIRQLNARLSDQNRQHRAVFESLPGLCLVLTPEFVIVTATDAYLRATMTEREKIRDRHLFEVFPDNPGDPSADGVRNLRASLERVRQLRQRDTMSIQKYDVQRPDGVYEERYWSPINSPVLNADDQLEYIIHRVEDVTDFVRQKSGPATDSAALRERLVKMEAEIYRSSQEIALANQQLRAVNTELEAFSYSVSHDLRAPLRHIDGFANLLQKNAAGTMNDQGRRYLATISASARQMGRLIDDLLSFSRMGRAELQLRMVDDHDALVAGIIHAGQREHPDRAVAWQVAPLPAVRADRAMLQQVWINLIDNAVKYSGRTAAPRIEIGARPDPAAGEVVFHVRDNGAGFDMRYAAKLFGVFQRLHSPGEFEGTGIGLANVRRIITRHGGRTWAEGVVGQGATFYFSLPLHPIAA